jgi:hypothetical protein
MARGVPTLRVELQSTKNQFGVNFSNMSATTIWGKVFRGTLFNKLAGRTLYWVIDSLDEGESETVSLIFQCLRTLPDNSKIKILLVSRDTADIGMRVAQLPLKKSIHQLSTADTYADIRDYIEDVIGDMIPKGVASRQSIIDKVLDEASSNFLWVTLAAKDLAQSWHLQSNIDHVLSGLPGEMTPRYDRMMEKIEKRPESTKRIATVLLAWAAYCFRPLQFNELTAALNSEFPDLTSLEDTIKHICSDFIQLRGTKVALVHEMARHNLITRYPSNREALHPSNSHGYITIVCLKYLSNSKDHQWRQILNLAELGRSPGSLSASSRGRDICETYPFLAYAATSWAYHLSLADPDSKPLLEALLCFFANDALTWINALALFGDLKSLIKAAQYLRAYVKGRNKELTEMPLPRLETDNTTTLRIWAIDLIRLVGKFGSNLIQNPSSIHRLIPPFCPVNSMLRKASGHSTFSVEGVSLADWDDCHARLSVGNEGSGRRVLATSEVFMALVPGAQSLIV